MSGRTEILAALEALHAAEAQIEIVRERVTWEDHPTDSSHLADAGRAITEAQRSLGYALTGAMRREARQGA